MVPHAGTDSELFGDVAELGCTLEALASIAGSEREPASVAILFDWDSWWASEQDSHPISRLDYHREALDWYSALLRLGIRADVVPAHRTDLSAYGLVIAPVLHVVPQTLVEQLARYIEGGGHLVTTYFSGIVDENDHVWPGGYPGALSDLLGIRIEEFGPLLDGDTVGLGNDCTGSLWTDRISVTGANVEVLARYRTGTYASRPAVTRRTGRGSAAYVSTRLGVDGLAALLPGLLAPAGVTSELPADVRGLVEHVVRRAAEHRYLFLINRSDEAVAVQDVRDELVHGVMENGRIALGPRRVAVLKQALGEGPAAEE
ncbi:MULTISPECIES: beta-galactosidase [Streptomyces]|uniref:beta-galactosidase n=1 Tax=Streptomyces TaxID=1883 RepID=UPI001EE63A95|nr:MULTISPECIES: beta-galactosidase trimerization domain-containing protein [Streptomyces]